MAVIVSQLLASRVRAVCWEAGNIARMAGRSLVQICAMHDPSVVELTTVENVSLHGARLTTQSYWEPGFHVEVKSTSGEFLRPVVPRGRARVVYCNAIDAKGFAIGLDFLSRTSRADV